MSRTFVLLFLVLTCPSLAEYGPGGYPKLEGGAFAGAKVTESPDPLVSYRWRKVAAGDSLQVYTLPPRQRLVETAGAFVARVAGRIG